MVGRYGSTSCAFLYTCMLLKLVSQYDLSV